jgi:hypothetical protein
MVEVVYPLQIITAMPKIKEYYRGKQYKNPEKRQETKEKIEDITTIDITNESEACLQLQTIVDNVKNNDYRLVILYCSGHTTPVVVARNKESQCIIAVLCVTKYDSEAIEIAKQCKEIKLIQPKNHIPPDVDPSVMNFPKPIYTQYDAKSCFILSFEALKGFTKSKAMQAIVFKGKDNFTFSGNFSAKRIQSTFAIEKHSTFPYVSYNLNNLKYKSLTNNLNNNPDTTLNWLNGRKKKVNPYLIRATNRLYKIVNNNDNKSNCHNQHLKSLLY